MTVPALHHSTLRMSVCSSVVLETSREYRLELIWLEANISSIFALVDPVLA
jgi:hypothetical protein